jgi:hypothetical protein
MIISPPPQVHSPLVHLLLRILPIPIPPNPPLNLLISPYRTVVQIRLRRGHRGEKEGPSLVEREPSRGEAERAREGAEMSF